MAKGKKTKAVDSTPAADTASPSTDTQNINISIEQICAAIVNTVGSVEVPIANLLNDYSGKSIAVNQNPDTKAVTFSLADNAEAAADTADKSE
jgi:hypothetical protein